MNDLSIGMGKTHFDAMHDIIEKCKDAEKECLRNNKPYEVDADSDY